MRFVIRPRSLFPSVPPTGRVLTQDQAFTIGHRLLEFGYNVRIEHVSRAITRMANGRVLMRDDGDEITINFRPTLKAFKDDVGSIAVATNSAEEKEIQRVIQQAAAFALATPSLAAYKGWPQEEYRFLPVSLWHEATVTAMGDARRATVDHLLTAFAKANVIGAATVGIVERSVAYFELSSLAAYCRETDAEVTVTARMPDGKSSGWAGQAARDWNRIDPDAIVAKAIDFAQRGANAQALEPGRRTTILGPAAVIQMMRHLAPCFDAAKSDDGRTPLSKPQGGNRLRQRLFDPRVTLVSDPADPDGGYPPFFEITGNYYSMPGIPVPAMTWVKDGVLENMAYSVDYGLNKGKPYCTPPDSLRMTGGPSSVDEMISTCQEGVYVNRLSDVELIDEKTGMLTGVTRDGCFLVKNGKVTKPLKNFRFLDSPFMFLNRLEMLGPTERTAFGHAPPSPGEFQNMGGWPPIERSASWPRLPMIVPSMKVRDFNFSALSDAV